MTKAETESGKQKLSKIAFAPGMKVASEVVPEDHVEDFVQNQSMLLTAPLGLNLHC